LIALSSLALLGRCFNAPFLDYDDWHHVFQNPQVMNPTSLWDIFTPQKESTYFPLTILSYRVDAILFSSWLENWATAIRLHTWIYHALASLVLWRIALKLRVSRNVAFFAAMIFAVHPTACETLCWVSERKNALSGFLFLASIWAYLHYYQKSWSALPVLILYTLALLAKPAALGLLPLFFVLELLGGPRWILGVENPSSNRTGGQATSGTQEMRIRFAKSLMLLIPAALIAYVCLRLNMQGHEKTIVPPPGGTIFTALLTDVEILVRYLLNFVAPFWLSFAYYVEPIATLGDGRLWLYGTWLVGLVGVSIRLTPRGSFARRGVILGWLWFFCGLSPMLNIVSIYQVMQDRYLYTALPGVLLVVAMLISCREFSRILRIGLSAGVSIFVLTLAVVGFERSIIYTNTLPLFNDAAKKQPTCAAAQSGLWLAYSQRLEKETKQSQPDARIMSEYRRRMGIHAELYMEQCPDTIRMPNYQEMAYEAAQFAMAERRLDVAEKYYRLAVKGLSWKKPQADISSNALINLAWIKLSQENANIAYDFANAAVLVMPSNVEARLVRARSIELKLKLKLPVSDDVKTQQKLDLQSVPSEHPLYPEAKALLQMIENR
jgi:hypothetical protein